MNKDGWPDLLMSTHLRYQFDAMVQLLINNGDGTFRDETSRIEQDWKFHRNQEECYGDTNGWLTGISVVDANNDSWPDIVVRGDSCLDYILFTSEEGERFVASENYSQLRNTNGNRQWGLVPGDVDNDGYLDIVLLYGDMKQQVYIRIPSQELDLVAASPAPDYPKSPQELSMPLEVSFRDDFENELQAGWEWISDDEPHWSITNRPGYLQFTLWTGYATDRLLRQAPEGDFEMVAKVRIDPVSNFQQAGLMIYQDQDNYLSFVKAYCILPRVRDLCVGRGVYFDKIYQGTVGWSNFPTEIDFAGDVYLRIIRVGDSFTAYYGADGGTWHEMGTHTANFQSPLVGIVAGASTYAINAEIDFFEISE
ncbi:MAG: VCBS repeat-containing protein [Deltaproteobacteria bacterium]|nr:VCBS repeat-containing protein [Deltaproteobacteria bacterium]